MVVFLTFEVVRCILCIMQISGVMQEDGGRVRALPEYIHALSLFFVFLYITCVCARILFAKATVHEVTMYKRCIL